MSLGATATTASNGCGLSFRADAPIATSHGEQTRGTLHVGEKVWAYNSQTKKIELEPIQNVCFSTKKHTLYFSRKTFNMRYAVVKTHKLVTTEGTERSFREMLEEYMKRFCTVCGKTCNPGPYYFTLKIHPGGIQEEVFLCERCKSDGGAGESPLTRVSALGHRQEQALFWHNEELLRPDQALNSSHVPLDNYPLIEDFEVAVEYWAEPKKRGKEAWHASARFISSSRGYLTYALDVDLSYPDFVLPSGNFEQPYRLDGRWDTLFTLIAEKDTFVYILTDNEKFTLIDGKRTYFYHAWFKVEKNRYYSQWEQAIYLARSLLRG